MRCVGRLFASIGLVTCVGGSGNVAFGQVADSAKVFTATLVGHVVDTSGAAVAGAEVIVARGGDSTVVGTAASNKRGSVTLKHLPAGGPFLVTARKIGYGSARGTVQLQAGDTLYVDFELPPLAVVLAPLTVTARRNRLRITADQFDPKLYRDALSLLVQQRRDMLGDPEQCPLPDSLLGGPGNDSISRIKVNDRLSILGLPKGDAKKDSVWRTLKRRLWLDSVRYAAMTVPDLPYVQQVYVNGVRVDWPKVSTTIWSTDKDGRPKPVHALRPIPGRSVVEALRDISADQIAEIRYADCWDRSVPFYKQYALYVVLKPPSQAVQDSILRSITLPKPAPR